MSDTGFDAKIKDLGDKLAGLTLKEAVDLGKYMKETYGIEAAAGGAVMVAAALRLQLRSRTASTWS